MSAKNTSQENTSNQVCKVHEDNFYFAPTVILRVYYQQSKVRMIIDLLYYL